VSPFFFPPSPSLLLFPLPLSLSLRSPSLHIST
jgi:hypothetical protein